MIIDMDITVAQMLEAMKPTDAGKVAVSIARFSDAPEGYDRVALVIQGADAVVLGKYLAKKVDELADRVAQPAAPAS